jgi:tryptophan synthase alpha chain
MSRLEACFEGFKKEGKTGIAAYLTVGHPDLAATKELVPAIVAGGADIIELGVPFSDPLADGATIQQSGHKALLQGVTLKHCLEVTRELRGRGIEAPILLMGYYNPMLSYGIERLCSEASQVGVDGFIVPDLPPEEADPLHRGCQSQGLDLVFLIAPNSPDHRIARVAAKSSGFLYCVSLIGVTGAREQTSDALPDFLARVRKHTSLPLAVGFGISGRAQVEEVGRSAEAVVVGSALIDVIEKSPPAEILDRARAFVGELAGKDQVD